MPNERLYTEAEAAEILKSALSKPEVEASQDGLTCDDIWRIAEEAGLSRHQFEAALVSAPSAEKREPTSTSAFGNIQLCTSISGELTEDDLPFIESAIPSTFGGKRVTQNGRSIKFHVDKGTGIFNTTVASRKGETSIQVTCSTINSIFLGGLAAGSLLFLGFLSFLFGNRQLWLPSLIVGPGIGLLVTLLTNRRNQRVAEELLSSISRKVIELVSTHEEQPSWGEEISTFLDVFEALFPQATNEAIILAAGTTPCTNCSSNV